MQHFVGGVNLRNIKTNIDREKLVSLMSNNLQILRLKVDVSQEELADILGYNYDDLGENVTIKKTKENGEKRLYYTIRKK